MFSYLQSEFRVLECRGLLVFTVHNSTFVPNELAIYHLMLDDRINNVLVNPFYEFSVTHDKITIDKN